MSPEHALAGMRPDENGEVAIRPDCTVTDLTVYAAREDKHAKKGQTMPEGILFAQWPKNINDQQKVFDLLNREMGLWVGSGVETQLRRPGTLSRFNDLQRRDQHEDESDLYGSVDRPIKLTVKAFRVGSQSEDPREIIPEIESGDIIEGIFIEMKE